MNAPRRALLALPALLLSAPARAVSLPEAAAQGAFLVGRDASGAALSLDGRALRVSPSGRFCLAFHREHGPEARLLVRRDGRSETRLIREEELGALDAVRLAPVIFQEYVPAEVDLRVTIVGDQIFPAAIHSQHTDYPVDFRMGLGQARTEPVSATG